MSSLVSFGDLSSAPLFPRLFFGPGLVFLSCHMLSLQSWTSLLLVLCSVCGLLVGSRSLSVLLSPVTICSGLMPFLPHDGLFWCLLLVSTSVVVRLLSSSVASSLCYCRYFCGVQPFSFILCLVGICCIVSGLACFLLLGFGTFVHRSLPGVIGVFVFALPLCGRTLFLVVLLPRSDLWFPSRRGLHLGRVKVYCFLCLARVSGFPSRGGLRLGRVSVSVTPLTHSHLRFP